MSSYHTSLTPNDNNQKLHHTSNNSGISSGSSGFLTTSITATSHSDSYSRSTFASNNTSNTMNDNDLQFDDSNSTSNPLDNVGLGGMHGINGMNGMLSSHMNDSLATKSKSDAHYDQGGSSALQAAPSYMNRANSHQMNGRAASPRFNSSNNDNNNVNDRGFRISLSGIGKNTSLLNRKDFNNDNTNSNTPNNNNINNNNNNNNNGNNENDDSAESQFAIRRQSLRQQRKRKPSTTRPTSHNPMFNANNNETQNITNDTNFNNSNNHFYNNRHNENEYPNGLSNIDTTNINGNMHHLNGNNDNNNGIVDDETGDYLPPTRLSRSHSQTQRPSPRDPASNGNNNHSHYLTSFDGNGGNGSMSRLRNIRTNPSSPTNENAGLSQEELVKRLKRRHSTIKTKDGLQAKRNNSIIGVLFTGKDGNQPANVQEAFNLGIPEDDDEIMLLPPSNNGSSGSLIEPNGIGNLSNSAPNGVSNSLLMLGGTSAATSLSTLPQLATNDGNESDAKSANITMGADTSPTPTSEVGMSVLSITEKRKLRQQRMAEWGAKMDNKIVCIEHTHSFV